MSGTTNPRTPRDPRAAKAARKAATTARTPAAKPAAKPKTPIRETPKPPSTRKHPTTGQTVTSEKTVTEIKLTTAQKAAEAARLRIQRYSWDYIAREVGYQHGASAYNAVKKHIESIPREAVEELRRMELESLDMAEKALQTQINNGDTTAINAMLNVKAQRAKLTGLYENSDGQVDVTLMRVQIATEMARLIKSHPDLSIDDIINQITKR